MDTRQASSDFKRILSLTEKGKVIAESSNLVGFSNTNPITDTIGIYVQLDGYFDSNDLLELKRALDDLTTKITGGTVDK